MQFGRNAVQLTINLVHKTFDFRYKMLQIQSIRLLVKSLSPSVPSILNININERPVTNG